MNNRIVTIYFSVFVFFMSCDFTAENTTSNNIVPLESALDTTSLVNDNMSFDGKLQFSKWLKDTLYAYGNNVIPFAEGENITKYGARINSFVVEQIDSSWVEFRSQFVIKNSRNELSKEVRELEFWFAKNELNLFDDCKVLKFESVSSFSISMIPEVNYERYDSFDEIMITNNFGDSTWYSYLRGTIEEIASNRTNSR